MFTKSLFKSKTILFSVLVACAQAALNALVGENVITQEVQQQVVSIGGYAVATITAILRFMTKTKVTL